jgi:HTH-type transcriptional regulator / antitoxin HigA
MTETNYAVAAGEYLEEWIDDRGFSQQHVADLQEVSTARYDPLD